MNPKRMVRLAIWTLALLAIAILGLLLLFWQSWPFDDRSFVVDHWRTAESRTRAHMADDARRHIPLGSSAREVKSLLGEPDEIIAGRQDAGGNSLDGRVTFSYYLGSWSMVAWDDAFLYVNFGDDDLVVSTEVNGY